MSGIRRQLAQSRPSGTSAVSLFKPGYDERIYVDTLVVVNTSGSSAACTVYHDADGTTYDETTTIVPGVTIQPNGYMLIEILAGIWSNAENIGIKTSVSNALTFTLYGTTDTETLQKLRRDEGV